MNLLTSTTRAHRGAAVALASVVALTAGLTSAAAVPAADAAQVASAAAQSQSDTEDGYYCRYVRGMSGAHYYRYRSTGYEWIPVGEIHTASNVKGRFAQGAEMSTTLAGGVSMNAGKTWSIGAEVTHTKSYKVDVQMATLGGGSNKKVLAKFKYQKLQLVCYDTDPRSGQIIRRDYTPKRVYTAQKWTTDLKYARASSKTPSCRTGRDSVPENKLYLPHGLKKSIVQSSSYTTSVTLSGIGVSGKFSSTSGTSRAFTFWTSSGSSYICGNKQSLNGSSKFYANRK